jgi:hypothetical protein
MWKISATLLTMIFRIMPKPTFTALAARAAAGKTGTAISLVEPIDRRLLRQIEQRLRQRLESSPIPSRTEVEAKRLAKAAKSAKRGFIGGTDGFFLAFSAGFKCRILIPSDCGCLPCK